MFRTLFSVCASTLCAGAAVFNTHAIQEGCQSISAWDCGGGQYLEIPIPLQDMADWEAQVFHAIKENVELLCGTRGESDEASKAVTKGNISVSSMGDQNMRVVSAQAKTEEAKPSSQAATKVKQAEEAESGSSGDSSSILDSIPADKTNNGSFGQ